MALVALAASPRSWAQKAEADAAFQRGRDLMAKGETAKACAEFEASMRFEPEHGTLYNLAICHARLGKLASAWTEFKELAANDTNAARGKDAGKRAAALEPRLTRMHLAIKAPPPGLVITRDGVDVTSLVGADTPVDPGNYTFVAQAPGRTPVTVSVALVGAGTTVDVELPELAAAAAPEQAAAGYPLELPQRPLALPRGLVEVTGLVALGESKLYLHAPVDLLVSGRVGLGAIEAEAGIDIHGRYAVDVNKPNQPASLYAAARYVQSPMLTFGADYTRYEPTGGPEQGSDLRALVARKRVITPVIALDGRAGVLYSQRRTSCGELDEFAATGLGRVQLAATSRVSFEALARLDAGLGGKLYQDTLRLAVGGMGLVAVTPQIDAVVVAYLPVAPSSDPEIFSIGAAWRSR
ncbi:MAG: tetratricopeptide repeat protein [Acidobacteriota bacterium]